MALTNSQYDQIMHVYEQRRLNNEYRLRDRFQKAYDLIPGLEDLDRSIASLSVQKAHRLLSGDDDALDSLRGELHTLIHKKQQLLTSHGLPSDYLELHYTCPDCQDTGYIGDRQCHCLKKAVIGLLYEQSNLQNILNRRTSPHFHWDIIPAAILILRPDGLHWKQSRPH